MASLRVFLARTTLRPCATYRYPIGGGHNRCTERTEIGQVLSPSTCVNAYLRVPLSGYQCYNAI